MLVFVGAVGYGDGGGACVLPRPLPRNTINPPTISRAAIIAAAIVR